MDDNVETRGVAPQDATRRRRPVRWPVAALLAVGGAALWRPEVAIAAGAIGALVPLLDWLYRRGGDSSP
jgi:hypothetical protein